MAFCQKPEKGRMEAPASAPRRRRVSATRAACEFTLSAIFYGNLTERDPIAAESVRCEPRLPSARPIWASIKYSSYFRIISHHYFIPICERAARLLSAAEITYNIIHKPFKTQHNFIGFINFWSETRLFCICIISNRTCLTPKKRNKSDLQGEYLIISHHLSSVGTILHFFRRKRRGLNEINFAVLWHTPRVIAPTPFRPLLPRSLPLSCEY